MNIEAFDTDVLRRYADAIKNHRLNLSSKTPITRFGLAEFMLRAAAAIEVRDLEVTNLRAELARANGEHRTPNFNTDDDGETRLDTWQRFMLCDLCFKPEGPDRGYFCEGHGEPA